MPGAEEFSKEPGSICKHAGELLQSGCHQAARQAIFQAAMSLLEAKLAEPVLVSFMAVAGMCGLSLPLPGCFCMCLCTHAAALFFVLHVLYVGIVLLYIALLHIVLVMLRRLPRVARDSPAQTALTSQDLPCIPSS